MSTTTPTKTDSAIKVEVTDLGSCKRSVQVEVPVTRIEQETEKGYKQLSGQMPIRGFRPGKAPRKLLERKFGAAVKEQVRQTVVEETLRQALIENELDILGDPHMEKVEGEEGEPLRYEVTLQVRPSFDLPDLETLAVVAEDIIVTEAEVDAELEKLRRTRAEYQPVDDGLVEKRDVVVCDVRFVLDEDIENESGNIETKSGEDLYSEEDVNVDLEEGAILLRPEGSDPLEIAAPDLSEDLRGLKPQESGESEVTLPAGFPVDKGRGRDAVAQLTVKDIKRLFIPEMTAEWAKETGYDSIDDLRSDIRSGLHRRQEMERRFSVEAQVMEKVVEAAGEFELPDDIVKSQANQLMEARRERLEAEPEAGDQAQDDEQQEALADLETEAQQAAARQIREMFVLQRLAREYKVFVTAEEIDEEVRRLAQMRGMPAKDVHRLLEEQGSTDMLRGELQNRKTRALLAARAKVMTPQEAKAEEEKGESAAPTSEAEETSSAEASDTEPAAAKASSSEDASTNS